MSDQTPQEVGIAERIARKAHADQRDLDGQPYIDHVARVVSMVDGDEAKAVAWLHDVLEDSPVTPEDLDAHGISLRVINAVRRLTRTAPREYAPYIDSLRAGQIAARVKVADLRDHLTPNCPDRLRPRYEAAIALLLLDDPVATLTARCEALEQRLSEVEAEREKDIEQACAAERAEIAFDIAENPHSEWTRELRDSFALNNIGRTAPYGPEPVFTPPVDASDEALRKAALDTASRLGLFAATWLEFQAFGLACRQAVVVRDAPFQEWAQGYLDAGRWAGHDRCDAVKQTLLERDVELSTLRADQERMREALTYLESYAEGMSEDAALLTPEAIRHMLKSMVSRVISLAALSTPRQHDKTRNQDEQCQCGHPYYRHFDTYEDMRAVGCKYCDCHTFVPRQETT